MAQLKRAPNYAKILDVGIDWKVFVCGELEYLIQKKKKNEVGVYCIW